MQKARCKIPILSLRKTPNETSEMISQMLYGETCVITEKTDGYAKITMDIDGVQGWVFALSLEAVEHTYPANVLADKVAHLITEKDKMLISFGAEIQSDRNENLNEKTPEYILYLAKKFMNTPYLYGGRSIFGVDASAFVQLVYKAVGISLPRFPADQANIGTTLDFVEESIGGELAFFDDEHGNINHAGIMLDNSSVLHCYGKIRVDSIDSTGIFNEEMNKHTHKLRFIKRILE